MIVTNSQGPTSLIKIVNLTAKKSEGSWLTLKAHSIVDRVKKCEQPARVGRQLWPACTDFIMQLPMS